MAAKRKSTRRAAVPRPLPHRKPSWRQPVRRAAILSQLPFQKSTSVGIGQLNFDLRNPRFTADHTPEGRTDVAVIRNLSEFADLGELLQSIATSGYIDIEPLVVTEESGELVVLEGNRRLAALKLLTNPKLAEEVGIVLPPITPGVEKTFQQVTVYRVQGRMEARDFIGFKHINGPHRWDSLAKAKFAAEWYRNEKHHGITLRDIAKRMGDRHDTIQRMVAGIYVLEQAEKRNLFRVDDRYPGRPFAFSHLYTALTRPGYRTFLGLSEDWRDSGPEPDPVPDDKLDNLKNVMHWLFGSKQDDIKPIVVSQNPNVKELGEVLANAKARAVLMTKGDLRIAYTEVETPALQFEKSLVEAHLQVENSLKKISAYDGVDETLYKVATEIQDNSNVIVSVMNSARKSTRDKSR